MATVKQLKKTMYAQSRNCETVRKHIGKIGSQPLAESWTVKGWVGEGYLWQGIIPHPTGENIDSLEAAITAALGTDDWGFQGDGWIGQWVSAKDQAKLAAKAKAKAALYARAATR